MAKSKEKTLVWTDTSPAAGGTTVSALIIRGGYLPNASILVVDAVLTGGTGGTLDVYLQRKTGGGSNPNDWTDWAHFPQLTAGQATSRYTFACDGSGTTTIQAVGGGTDAAPGVALAANTYTNVMPGGRREEWDAALRVVFVAGASTSAGASQKISISPYTEKF